VSQDAKWIRALDRFKCGAKAYLKAYGKPAVIVYDNASRLARETPQILDILQDDAKENADYSKYISLFVTNEETVLMRMQDLTKDESMDFLVNKNGIPLKEADQFYNLLGGRFIYLKRAIQVFKETRSFD
ncbi:2648_t:CDS:2, partial [Racocetra persica]